MSWESAGDVLMLLFWNRCSFLPALQAFLQWRVGYLTQELTLQFGVGFFALPSRNRSNSILEHPAGRSQAWLPGGAGAPGVVPVPGAAVSPRVAGAGSRYDCVPPPPKAPVTGLGTSYDWPLSPPPLGSAAESPF